MLSLQVHATRSSLCGAGDEIQGCVHARKALSTELHVGEHLEKAQTLQRGATVSGLFLQVPGCLPFYMELA